MDKVMIRDSVLHKVKNLTEYERATQEERIYETLFSLKQWKEAQCVFVYKNFRTEISTQQVFDEARRENKTVAVPHIMNQHKMVFLKIDEQTKWGKNKWGIEEISNVSEATELVPNLHDLMIVPGVVFSVEGQRIGWGGGYYDRYLEGRSCNTIGLAYSEQMKQNLPVESHDITIQQIITAGMIFD
ncbi:MAG: 5-formyltetrahydrofolate cyclo-ligase [Bacilli bacterium]